jgi:outer membrane protein assembly factor BamE
MPVPLRRFAICAAVAFALAGCQTMDRYFPTARNFGVYKLDINQGNYLTADQVEKLKTGMSEQQVRIALGTPLLVDPFHGNRWDYVYAFTRQGRVTEERRFHVFFADGKLERWEGDDMPPSSIELNRNEAPVSLSERPRKKKGWFESTWDWISNPWRSDDKPAPAASASAPPAAAEPAAASTPAPP